VAGPNCYQNPVIVGGQNTQLCVQPHIRPTFQRLPELDAWNATIQHQLTNTMTLGVGYIGNKGTHVFPGDGPTYNATPPSIVGYPTVPQVQRRPLYNKFSYPGYIDPSTGTTLMCCSTDQGNYLGSDCSSNYNALQVKVEKRFSHGLQFLSHYTFAHAYKYDNNYYATSPGIAYGPDDQVRNQVWVNNVVYALPFGRGQPFGGGAGRAENLVIGGWQISGTTTCGSGLPWTPSFNECGTEEDVSICRPNKGTGSFHTGAGSFNPVTHVVPFFTPVPDIVTSIGVPSATQEWGTWGTSVSSATADRGSSTPMRRS
jgi:hypothetical protein